MSWVAVGAPSGAVQVLCEAIAKHHADQQVTDQQVGDMDDVADFGCGHLIKTNGADMRAIVGDLEPRPLNVPRAWGFDEDSTDTCGW